MTPAEKTAADFKAGRKLLGLSQTEMAAMCGCTLRSVQNWEGGEYAVSDHAARLMQAYLDGYRPADWPKAQQG